MFFLLKFLLDTCVKVSAINVMYFSIIVIKVLLVIGSFMPGRPTLRKKVSSSGRF